MAVESVMDMTAEIGVLQAQAETMMTDRCLITRAGVPTGTPTIDPATGLYPPLADVTVYTGKCSIVMPGSFGAKVRPSAGDAAALLDATVSIPANAVRLVVGDQIIFTSSGFNPNLVGLVFRVTAFLPGSHITKQRVSVEAVID